MLTPEYLKEIVEASEYMFSQLREDIVSLMTERFIARIKRGEDFEITPANKILADTLMAAGVVYQDVIQLIKNCSGESDKIVREAFKDAGGKAYKYEQNIYEKVGLPSNYQNMSPSVKRIVNRNYKATNGEMQNITRSTAQEAQRTFIDTCSQSLFALQTGSKSLSQVYLDGIKKIAKEGGYVEYESGRRDTVETATLRALRTGICQTSAEITIERTEEMGYDLVLVSAHLGARVNPADKVADHAGWQGRVYSISGKTDGYGKLEEATGYPGNPLGLCGYNCRHNITIFIPGISRNPYIDKKGNLLIDTAENRKKYEAEQKARRMERAIRSTKIKKAALQTAYDNTEGKERGNINQELKKEKERLQRQNKVYRDFMDENDMKTLDYRVKVAPRDIENRTIVKETPNDILRHVGKIDKSIYKCITEDITTDEVIITNERIGHVMERHPNDYERYCGYLKDIVENPRYIIETKKPNTAFILSEFAGGREKFKTILRIITSKDNPNFKNSIITFMKINDKEWRRLLRNKVILYKNE